MNTAAAGAALVTGAARRIGRTIALELARHGWSVGVHYNGSERDAQSVVAEIRAAGGRAVALPADLAVEVETAALIDRTRAALGPLTLLVNNASVFERDDADTVTRDSWDRHMEINLRAPFVLMQGFARQVPPETAGNIINIIDQRVWNLTAFFTSYTVSKVGLWTLTRTLAMALAPKIRVNAIGPGPVLPSSRQTEAMFRTQYLRTPLQRPAAPEEIAAAVLFLLGAPSLTGQMIAVDAGQHLGMAPIASAPEDGE